MIIDKGQNWGSLLAKVGHLDSILIQGELYTLDLTHVEDDPFTGWEAEWQAWLNVLLSMYFVSGLQVSGVLHDNKLALSFLADRPTTLADIVGLLNGTAPPPSSWVRSWVLEGQKVKEDRKLAIGLVLGVVAITAILIVALR